MYTSVKKFYVKFLAKFGGDDTIRSRAEISYSKFFDIEHNKCEDQVTIMK